jgi:hypothetical protein
MTAKTYARKEISKKETGVTKSYRLRQRITHENGKSPSEIEERNNISLTLALQDLL